ncbi:hypothetical protein FEV53_09005 [Palleronia caenipelagi]|uniref:Class I SAM-dependent methyltransferase n=1 Tax=Palleronia caenipelagi TaxID=2489174 RepID=A0A547Q371_9RHOB|nr:hypothetical protein FEV53_09005 [Palleronia caenipelagi]
MSFDPEVAEYVSDWYGRSDVILEYGSGGSTVLAAQQTHRAVYSVESDRDWADRLRRSLDAACPGHSVELIWQDIGPTRKWGAPRTNKHMLQFPGYALDVWSKMDGQGPDLVLVDGRFRLGCFLATLFNITRPTTLLWDDYAERRKYHLAERYGAPVERVGRMVRFELTPRQITPADLPLLARAFVDQA